MVRRTSAVMTLLMMFISASAYAQQNEHGALSVLHSSLASMIHGGSVQDVTLVGSVRTIAGAVDESGTITLKAAPGGFSRIEFNLPSESRIETSTAGEAGIKGKWKGHDEKLHATAPHNLAAPDWFFPAFLIQRILSQRYVVSFVGNETRDGVSVAHFSAYMSRPGVKPAVSARLLERASQVDLFVDPGSGLPTAVCFSLHPDNDAGFDIPVEIRFGEYRSVNGMQAPHHIEKYVNSTLTTDIQVQSVEFNTGLTASSFDAQ